MEFYFIFEMFVTFLEKNNGVLFQNGYNPKVIRNFAIFLYGRKNELFASKGFTAN